ncbi:Hypothetical predicted protein [Marmota monax]|uniref:Uncharacterized protein n=1 Tax=Marmota monax TaxID=9995 RepID=A0A5E4AXH6_MARMO|nr:Hypothetical predicted protein [Marmota monax]
MLLKLLRPSGFLADSSAGYTQFTEQGTSDWHRLTLRTLGNLRRASVSCRAQALPGPDQRPGALRGGKLRGAAEPGGPRSRSYLPHEQTAPPAAGQAPRGPSRKPCGHVGRAGSYLQELPALQDPSATAGACVPGRAARAGPEGSGPCRFGSVDCSPCHGAGSRPSRAP